MRRQQLHAKNSTPYSTIEKYYQEKQGSFRGAARSNAVRNDSTKTREAIILAVVILSSVSAGTAQMIMSAQSAQLAPKTQRQSGKTHPPEYPFLDKPTVIEKKKKAKPQRKKVKNKIQEVETVFLEVDNDPVLEHQLKHLNEKVKEVNLKINALISQEVPPNVAEAYHEEVATILTAFKSAKLTYAEANLQLNDADTLLGLKASYHKLKYNILRELDEDAEGVRFSQQDREKFHKFLDEANLVLFTLAENLKDRKAYPPNELTLLMNELTLKIWVFNAKLYEKGNKPGDYEKYQNAVDGATDLFMASMADIIGIEKIRVKNIMTEEIETNVLQPKHREYLLFFFNQHLENLLQHLESTYRSLLSDKQFESLSIQQVHLDLLSKLLNFLSIFDAKLAQLDSLDEEIAIYERQLAKDKKLQPAPPEKQANVADKKDVIWILKTLLSMVLISFGTMVVYFVLDRLRNPTPTNDQAKIRRQCTNRKAKKKKKKKKSTVIQDEKLNLKKKSPVTELTPLEIIKNQMQLLDQGQQRFEESYLKLLAEYNDAKDLCKKTKNQKENTVICSRTKLSTILNSIQLLTIHDEFTTLCKKINGLENKIEKFPAQIRQEGLDKIKIKIDLAKTELLELRELIACHTENIRNASLDLGLLVPYLLKQKSVLVPRLTSDSKPVRTFFSVPKKQPTLAIADVPSPLTPTFTKTVITHPNPHALIDTRNISEGVLLQPKRQADPEVGTSGSETSNTGNVGQIRFHLAELKKLVEATEEDKLNMYNMLYHLTMLCNRYESHSAGKLYGLRLSLVHPKSENNWWEDSEKLFAFLKHLINSDATSSIDSRLKIAIESVATINNSLPLINRTKHATVSSAGMFSQTPEEKRTQKNAAKTRLQDLIHKILEYKEQFNNPDNSLTQQYGRAIEYLIMCVVETFKDLPKYSAAWKAVEWDNVREHRNETAHQSRSNINSLKAFINVYFMQFVSKLEKEWNFQSASKPISCNVYV